MTLTRRYVIGSCDRVSVHAAAARHVDKDNLGESNIVVAIPGTHRRLCWVPSFSLYSERKHR